MIPSADRTKHMASLLANVDETALDWQPADLPGLLRHQMAASLVDSLTRMKRVDILHGNPGFATFADLFTHPAPPVDLLNLVKDFAKYRRRLESLPPEIDMILYLAAIAAAKVRCGTVISSTSAAELNHQMASVAALPWLCEPLVSLFACVCCESAKPVDSSSISNR